MRVFSRTNKTASIEPIHPESTGTESTGVTSEQWAQYWDGYKTIEGWRYDTSKSYDTAVLTLSTAVIGAILTFLAQLKTVPDDIPLFGAACGCLGLAILTTLASFLLADTAMGKKSTGMWDLVIKGAQVQPDWVNRLVPITPRIAGLSFALGLAFAFSFVFTNYTKIGSNATTTKTTSTDTPSATTTTVAPAPAKTDSITGRTGTKELRPGSH